MNIVLITGNKGKLEYFSKFIGIEFEHKNIDLDEIQSLNLREIIKHKVVQAYNKVKRPVVVEDVSLEFKSLGRLPGPFIKFFLKELSMQDICDLLTNKPREAIVRCAIGYYDGENIEIFEGELPGTISKYPAGEKGFGWDKFFIPDGYDITRGEMNEEDYKETYLKIRRLDLLKEFLDSK